MKKSYLLPNYFKKIGWCIVVPGIIILLLGLFKVGNLNFSFKFIGFEEMFFEDMRFGIVDADFINTIIPIIIIVGLLFITFAKEKIEDEMITQLREKSFAWAVKVYAIILIVGILFTYQFSYLYFLAGMIYVIFILFIIKFNVELSRSRRSLRNEK
ncbi:hypothetical protein LJC25_00840 [Bacteroidales bacterium OttesenSCG-928-K03]|nr:hypothetical protein [Bacteroidales bacterium OttesenSCG-928-L14]MDL2240031.1 hypothetical protein [Bacteroidales bacterium OttesenSCG-928-K22]MDL2242257.1 hypothetical protein [Bacteroidales bacterium OttesenSCG-928-K03]